MVMQLNLLFTRTLPVREVIVLKSIHMVKYNPIVSA